MSYPGNPSLGREVQERILTTYAQTLGLAKAGDRQEAILGCDFILQLDPLFAPAETLRERLASGDGAVDVSDLTGSRSNGAGAGSAAPDAARAEADALFDFDDALDAGSGAGGGLETELAALLAARDHEGVMARAQDHREAVMASPALREIVQTAQARLEAEPYVRTFLENAEAAAESGDRAQLEASLDKARALDPSHPAIARLAALSGEAPAAAPPAAPPGDEPDLDLDGFDVFDDAPAAEAPVEAELDLSEDDWAIDDDEPVAAAPEPPDESAGAPAAASLDLDALGSFDALDDFDEGGLDLPDLSFPEPEAPAAPASAAPASPTPPADAAPPAPPATSAGAPELAIDESSLPSLDLGEPTGTPASGSAGGDGDGRIAQLLAEGEAARERGDYQAAIDAWSRIFLIDVDHREAADRIEQARRMKAEQERQVEEIYHEGLALLESGEQEAARERFVRVLDIQPNHLASREYLQQIDSGEPVDVSSARGGSGAGAGSMLDFELDDDLGLGGSGGGGSDPLQEEILVPPSPPDEAGGSDAASPIGRSGATVAAGNTAFRGSGAKKERSPRTFLLIGGLVLVIVLVGGWFLWQNASDVFPNSTPEEGEETQAIEPAASAIERATRLHEEGKTALAVSQLKRLRPDSPDYAEAQGLIATWEAATAPGGAGEEAGDGIDPAVLERRALLVEAGDEAFAGGDFLRARDLYQTADEIVPLEPEPAARYARVEESLEPFAAEIMLFEDGEYDDLLPRLWRELEADRSNRVVRGLIVDTYYNLGVRELQRGDTRQALEHFQEALELAPDDEELARHALLADTYGDRPKDLLYRIYVKYLPFR